MKSAFARILCAAAMLLALAWAFVTLSGPHGLAALRERHRQIQDLEKRNGELHREIEAKRQRIKLLRESEAAQEIEIRDRWKLVKPGEKVFIIQDPERGPSR